MTSKLFIMDLITKKREPPVLSLLYSVTVWELVALYSSVLWSSFQLLKWVALAAAVYYCSQAFDPLESQTPFSLAIISTL
jgi:hypothetical protein